MDFKPKFIERYQQLTDWDAFSLCSLSYPRKSIRVNTLKISVDECRKRLEKKGWELIPIPWCKEGFWISGHRYDIGNLLEHSLGYIYVQDASSMIPPLVLCATPTDTVLDLCASPGSKSSQIAMMMGNQGTLVANDVTGDRLAPLGLNLQRCGVTNTIITQTPGERIHGLAFDKVLVDAPCSGTGTIAKSWKTITMWNPAMVKKMSGLQYKLLCTGFENLKSGGTLVYSTCSMEPEEDEGVVSRFVEAHADAELQDIDLPLKRSPIILEFEGKSFSLKVKKCLRIWPQDNNTEGFFVAKLRKAK